MRLTARFFVIIAAIFIAFILNVALVLTEFAPQPIGKETQEEVKDELASMRFTKGKRSGNLKKLGLTDELTDKAIAEIERLQKAEKRSPLLLPMIKDKEELGGLLCPRSRGLTTRYAAAEFLIREDGGIRKAIDGTTLRKAGLSAQIWFDEATVENVYKMMELTQSRTEDATARGIAAIMLKKEEDVFNREGMFGGGLFGQPTLVTVVTNHPEIEDELVTYFATLHYMAEVANDPESDFCNKKKSSASDAEEGG